jgi:hypothetical protein
MCWKGSLLVAADDAEDVVQEAAHAQKSGPHLNPDARAFPSQDLGFVSYSHFFISCRDYV